MLIEPTIQLIILIFFTKSIPTKCKCTKKRFSIVGIHANISCPCAIYKDRFYIILIIFFT